MTGPFPAEPEPERGRRADGEPRPVAEIDDRLFDALRPLHRVRWITLTTYALFITAAVIILAVLYRNQMEAIRTSCRFYGAIAGIPAQPAPPANTPPSKVLITLIAGARDSYVGQGCGPLPAPSAGLTHWASVYHIPVR